MDTASKTVTLKQSRWMMYGIVFVFFAVLVVGIQRDLPYTPDFDEANYVERAVRMASSGNLNPERFAHPASTTYYPLTAFYHVWYAVTHKGMLLHPDPNLQIWFYANFWEFYILGRFLSIIYAVLSLPLIYLLGREVFNLETGVTGALFFSFYSLIVFYSRMVRTDSAALFFVLLALWRLTQVYRKPTSLNYLLAGVFTGLSIASRYFMVILVPVFAVVHTAIFLRQKDKKSFIKPFIVYTAIGFGAIAVAFILSTPYFFVSFDTLMADIALERRDTNPGFDGLSPVGNFVWYITYALPSIISLPQVAFMVVGIGFSLQQRRFFPLALLGFALTFVIFISQFSLHWYRWLIQILPIAALFAAYGICRITGILSDVISSRGTNRNLYKILLGAGILLLLFMPIKTVAALNLKAAHYSTRILAREWVLKNLDTNSRVAVEEYSAVLENTDFDIFKSWSLAQANHTLDDYRHDYDYIIVSSSIYDRFFAEPERYPDEIVFYRELFDKEKLVQKFEPDTYLGGHTIQIFQLR